MFLTLLQGNGILLKTLLMTSEVEESLFFLPKWMKCALMNQGIF